MFILEKKEYRAKVEEACLTASGLRGCRPLRRASVVRGMRWGDLEQSRIPIPSHTSLESRINIVTESPL